MKCNLYYNNPTDPKNLLMAFPAVGISWMENLYIDHIRDVIRALEDNLRLLRMSGQDANISRLLYSHKGEIRDTLGGGRGEKFYFLITLHQGVLRKIILRDSHLSINWGRYGSLSESTCPSQLRQTEEIKLSKVKLQYLVDFLLDSCLLKKEALGNRTASVVGILTALNIMEEYGIFGITKVSTLQDSSFWPTSWSSMPSKSSLL